MRAAQHQRIDAVCKQWFEVFAYGQAGNFMSQPTFRIGTGMLFVTEFVEAVFLYPTGIFVLTRCGLAADLPFFIDFNLFCRFDELSIPDYSTLCRYRNWLAQDDTLSELLELINRQLTEKNLKVEKASAAVIDATIIQTAGSKQRQAIEVDEEGQVSGQTTPSKDKDARWTKKNGLYRLGYKQHTRTDEEGYIEKLYITPANTHECNHLSPLLEGIAEGTTVYADKGYDSKENRQHLKEHQLLDGIMRKAHRNRPLTEAQTKRNRYLSKTRYVVEQSFGTLHRKFRYARAAYFGLIKVSAQSHLKAMCLNLLKAANRLSVPAAA